MVYCQTCEYVVDLHDVHARKCPHCGADPAKDPADKGKEPKKP